MRRHLCVILVAVACLAFPGQAMANAGTPLMWAGMFHLVVGNLFIGLLEGILLARFFKIPQHRAVNAMIAANYVSAWIGGLFISSAIVEWLPMDLNNGWMWFWIMVGVTYCLTVALEWPLIAWVLRGSQGWLKRSLRASVMIQGASYLLLFGGYWFVSDASLYTRMNIVAPADLSLPESVLVYFINPVDWDVYRRPLTKVVAERIHKLSSTHRNDRLFTRPNMHDPDRWDIVARLEGSDHQNPQFVPVLMDISVEAALDSSTRWSNKSPDPPRHEGTWFNFGKVQRLDRTNTSEWEFRTGFYPIEGMIATRETTGEKVHFSYDTPFVAWSARNAVHLPGDTVLFQFGKDQICVFDPAKRQVALLWKGRGPVAVIPVETKVSVLRD